MGFRWGRNKRKRGLVETCRQRVFVFSNIAVQLLKQHHETTHLQKSVLESLLSSSYSVPKLPTLCPLISARYVTCAWDNVSQGPRPSPGVQTLGTLPFEDLEIDFTEVKPCKCSKYLPVVVCTYSGCAEACPRHAKWAPELAKALLREIIPRYGLPLSIGYDNGTAFAPEIIQTLSKTLMVKWKLHTAYRPQSSGKVEHMSQTLKTMLVTLCQETQLPWVDMVPQRCSEPSAPWHPQAILPLRSTMGDHPQW